MMNIIRLVFFAISFLTGLSLSAQQAAYRRFSEDKIDELRKSGDYDYQRPVYEGESLWERFISIIREWLSELFGSGPTSSQIEVTFYLIALAILIWVIVKLLGIEVQGAFRKPLPKPAIAYQVNEENLDQIDFKEEISQALNARQWRVVIRLQYLFALKMLAGKGLITVVSGKTNHDYLYELEEESISQPFSRLSTLFEYTWYGEFEVTEHILKEAQGQFETLEAGL
ncbi:MAG: DUF4129 domain-containing protein [Owenweeksia sp.]